MILSNTVLFVFITFISFIGYMDRGIIPGASVQINAFIAQQFPDNENPDTLFGLLQSAFVAGYSVSCLISTNALHTHTWDFVLLVTMVLFTLTLVGCGLSGESFGNYYMLLAFRALSGGSEAACLCIFPPLIQDRAKNDSVAKWLSFYFTSIPLGVAVGYVYGAYVAQYDWKYAYYLEAVTMIPVLLFLFFVVRKSEEEQLTSIDKRGLLEPGSPLISENCRGKRLSSPKNSSTRRVSRLEDLAEIPSIREELMSCLNSPVFVLIVLSYSSYTATITAVATYGSSFFLALGFFDDEVKAAFVFGGIVCVAGIVGTPMGGVIIDRFKGTSSSYLNDRDTETDIDRETDTDREEETKFRILETILNLMTLIIVCGMVIVWQITYVESKTIFLTCILAGCLTLFMSTSFFNLGSMLAVPSEHRPFAVGLLSLAIHAFGDVPSPIIIGYIKDYLAPLCNVDADGNFIDIDGCKSQSGGIRETLQIAIGWLIFCPVFSFIGARVARASYKNLQNKRMRV